MAVGINIRRKNRTRKPYQKSRRFDTSCRSHGGCPWCLSNRFIQKRKLELAAKDEVARATILL